MMTITTKFPRIRNGLSSRCYLLMFLSVGAAWGGQQQVSPRCHTGAVTRGVCVSAGGAAEQNGISGIYRIKSILNCQSHYLSLSLHPSVSPAAAPGQRFPPTHLEGLQSHGKSNPKSHSEGSANCHREK